MTFVEIKAFHKNQGITPREIKQLKRYMEANNCGNGILITTSAQITTKTEKGIEIIDANRLIKLLKMNGLQAFIPSVNWIMNERVGFSDEEYKKRVKDSVIEYFKRFSCRNTRKQLEKAFSIDLRTYSKRH